MLGLCTAALTLVSHFQFSPGFRPLASTRVQDEFITKESLIELGLARHLRIVVSSPKMVNAADAGASVRELGLASRLCIADDQQTRVVTLPLGTKPAIRPDFPDLDGAQRLLSPSSPARQPHVNNPPPFDGITASRHHMPLRRKQIFGHRRARLV